MREMNDRRILHGGRQRRATPRSRLNRNGHRQRKLHAIRSMRGGEVGMPFESRTTPPVQHCRSPADRRSRGMPCAGKTLPHISTACAPKEPDVSTHVDAGLFLRPAHLRRHQKQSVHKITLLRAPTQPKRNNCGSESPEVPCNRLRRSLCTEGGSPASGRQLNAGQHHGGLLGCRWCRHASSSHRASCCPRRMPCKTRCGASSRHTESNRRRCDR